MTVGLQKVQKTMKYRIEWQLQAYNESFCFSLYTELGTQKAKQKKKEISKTTC